MHAPLLPLASIVELPPELTGALTFHLPLEVFALEHCGATPQVVDERIAAGLDDAFRSGLVDPPFYRWAVSHYAEVGRDLLDPARCRAAFARIEALGEGLPGAAFHGVIRLGYGALRGDPAEISRGLAYLRTRRQVLGGGRSEAGEVSFPEAEVLEGTTVFDQLDLAAAAGGHDELTDPSTPLAHPRRYVQRAGELIRRDPSSFVAIHAMTGLHGLAEFHTLVCATPPGGDLDDTPLAPWWRAYAAGLRACTLVVGSSPANPPSCAVEERDLDALVADAIASGDTHSVKLVVALRRLVQFGLLAEDELFALGDLKLAADACTE